MIRRFRLPLWLAEQPHFDTPIVVFQSDDWGQPCTTDRGTLERAVPDTYSSDAAGWLFDAKESAADVEGLAALLSAYRDAEGRPACFTLNFIVQEPDYDAIEAANFNLYVSRPLRETTAAMAARRAAAMRDGVFELALHGGEHVAPARWLSLLRGGARDLRGLFAARVMPPPAVVAKYPGLGAAYLPCPDSESDPGHTRRLQLALETFGTMFGHPAAGFVAPNHAWDADVEATLAASGVQFLQASQVCYETWSAAESAEWFGRRAGPSKHPPLWYQTRTVDFEPAIKPAKCDGAIAKACLLAQRGIPVVVNTHRINYVSSLRPERAELGRAQLRQLLEALLRTRRDLRFMSSGELDLSLRGCHPTVKRRRTGLWGSLAVDLFRAGIGAQPDTIRTQRPHGH